MRKRSFGALSISVALAIFGFFFAGKSRSERDAVSPSTGRSAVRSAPAPIPKSVAGPGARDGAVERTPRASAESPAAGTETLDRAAFLDRIRRRANPVAGVLEDYLRLYSGELAHSEAGVVAYEQRLVHELLADPSHALTLISEGLHMAARTDELVEERAALYGLVARFPVAGRSEIRAVAVADMIRHDSALRAPADASGLSDRAAVFLDRSSILMPMTAAQAFFAASGDDPRRTLDELRPALSGTMNPSIRRVYEAAFRRRYPSFRGEVK